MIDFFERSTPQQANEIRPQRERRLRTQAIDVCRFLLPAASLANVGMTINARALEHAIGKMLTSPLQEVREIGAEIKAAAAKSVPTLLKYADEIPYLRGICNEFAGVNVNEEPTSEDWCTLVHFDQDGINRLLAASLYREQNIDYAKSLAWVQKATPKQKQELLHCLLGDLDSHTIPARELENVTFTFDLLMDQGAYFEVKRHRMMTQTPQHLTARLGYAVPKAISDAGMLPLYTEAMQSAQQTYTYIAEQDPDLAAYVVPNGFNRRVLLTLNLRSALHFIRLRSAPNAHFSVRRVAQRMAEDISRAIPELAGFLGRNEAESSSNIETNSFSEPARVTFK